MSLWGYLISKQSQKLQIKQFLNNLAAGKHIMYIYCMCMYTCVHMYVCVAEINSQNSIWSYRWHRPWIFLFILFYLTFSCSNSINNLYDHNKLRSALWKILWNKTETKTKHFHWRNNVFTNCNINKENITRWIVNHSLHKKYLTDPTLTLQQQKQEVATQIAASLPKKEKKK